MRLLFLGDSNTHGLGAGGAAYPVLVGRALAAAGISVEVFNAGVNGHTAVTHVAKLSEYVAYKPDVVVMWLGCADALCVPQRDVKFDLVRFLPRRYRQLGWLQPRPYLPTRWWKRNLYARPESYVRSRVGRFIMRVQGVRSALPFEQFEPAVRRLFETFMGIRATVITCGLGPVDDALFPGSKASFALYGEVVATVGRIHGCRHVEVAPVLREPGHLLLDNLHPNARGHAAIAGVLLPVLREAIAERQSIRLSLESGRV